MLAFQTNHSSFQDLSRYCKIFFHVLHFLCFCYCFVVTSHNAQHYVGEKEEKYQKIDSWQKSISFSNISQIFTMSIRVSLVTFYDFWHILHRFIWSGILMLSAAVYATKLVEFWITIWTFPRSHGESSGNNLYLHLLNTCFVKQFF